MRFRFFHFTPSRFRPLFHVTCFFVAVASWGDVRAEPVVLHDWGPFYARWTDVQGHDRSKSFGPVVESIHTPEGWDFNAIRPLYATWNHEGDAVRRREFLWPVARSSRRKDAHSWRFLLVYGVNWDVNDPESRNRFWALPFWFHGRDAEGEPYFALFPIGGTIREFLLWDQIDFVLFPVWVRSQVKEIEANTYLWPLISRTEGPGVSRGRFFPFYGYNEREGLGRKSFVLWPFWTSVRYEIPGHEGSGWILFPVTGHLKLESQESWWILPPLFRYHIGEEKNRLLGPWPFVQVSSGEVDKFYLWPVYGTKTIGSTQRDFFVWPLGWHERVAGAETNTRRVQLVPFFRDFQETEMQSGETVSRYTKVWPLYSHTYREEGPVRRTVFPDLNPFREGPVERNWAPFWHLYTREQVGDAVDTEVLWGFYRSVKRGDDIRHRSLFPLVSWGRGEDKREVSLLKGLLGWRREDEKNQFRVLYLFRFGGKNPESSPSVSEP